VICTSRVLAVRFRLPFDAVMLPTFSADAFAVALNVVAPLPVRTPLILS
jgi:hypothetical protein